MGTWVEAGEMRRNPHYLYQILSFAIYRYLSLSISIRLYPSLSASICLYHLCHVHICIYIYVDVCWRYPSSYVGLLPVSHIGRSRSRTTFKNSELQYAHCPTAYGLHTSNVQGLHKHIDFGENFLENHISFCTSSI